MDEAAPEVQSRTQHQQEWAVLMHDLRTPLTVLMGRIQLLRRHMRRGDDAVHIDTDLEAIEAAIVRLTAAVERLDRDRAATVRRRCTDTPFRTSLARLAWRTTRQTTGGVPWMSLRRAGESLPRRCRS